MTARNCSGGVIDTNSTSAKTADFSRQAPITHSLFLSWYSGKRSEITCSNLAGFCTALSFWPPFFFLIWIHHYSHNMCIRELYCGPGHIHILKCIKYNKHLIYLEIDTVRSGFFINISQQLYSYFGFKNIVTTIRFKNQQTERGCFRSTYVYTYIYVLYVCM